MQSILDSGIVFIVWLQSLGDGLVGPMKVFTMLGNEEFYLLAAPILYWCIDTRLGLRMGLLLMFSDSLNNFFKILVHSPRPYWFSTQVRALSVETSFGPPSGHAQNAASVWGMLGATLGGRWAPAAAMVLIFLIGLSRVCLGVHNPFDVALGWLVGALLMVAFLKLEGPVGDWLKRLSPWEQAGAALGTSLALILLGVLARLGLAGWTAPAAWVENARLATGADDTIRPLAYAGLITNAGTLFGLAAGAILAATAGGYDPGGALWKRAVRFLIGLVGVLILWRGLGLLLPGGEGVLPLILRWVRYALVGLWVTGLAPMLFVRLGLALAADDRDPAPPSAGTRLRSKPGAGVG
jgi:membrane-associated phospholipid phosphatase